jgi:hypothetical protein
VRRLALLALLPLAACGSDDVSLPDPSAPATQAESVRVATLLEADPSDRLTPMPRRCAVRVLRVTGTTTYGFATCTAGSSAVSLPLRVAGSSVEMPRDGSFAEDLDRLFPKDLAKALADHPDRYRP